MKSSAKMERELEDAELDAAFLRIKRRPAAPVSLSFSQSPITAHDPGVVPQEAPKPKWYAPLLPRRYSEEK